MTTEEIKTRIAKLKETVRGKQVLQGDRLTRIKELFIKLKAGFDYMEKNPDDPEKNQRLIERAKPIVVELETLGVHETFSLALLVFGPLVTNELVDQFIE